MSRQESCSWEPGPELPCMTVCIVNGQSIKVRSTELCFWSLQGHGGFPLLRSPTQRSFPLPQPLGPFLPLLPSRLLPSAAIVGGLLGDSNWSH